MEKENTQSFEESTVTPDGGRTFTQDEVNRIIQERLARDRTARNEPDQNAQREKELTERENRLTCREYLSAQKLPEALMDIFDTADAERFQASIEKLIEMYPSIDPNNKIPRFVSTSPGALKDEEDDNNLRKAFHL